MEQILRKARNAVRVLISRNHNHGLVSSKVFFAWTLVVHRLAKKKRSFHSVPLELLAFVADLPRASWWDAIMIAACWAVIMIAS